MPKKKVTEAVEETAQETIPVEKAPAQMPRRQGSEDLLELNDLERGVTREDSEEAKWGYLAGAVRRQQILTGIVSAGMTYTENGMPIVPIDFATCPGNGFPILRISTPQAIWLSQEFSM